MSKIYINPIEEQIEKLKNDGVYYTPKEVCELITRICDASLKENSTLADLTCGTGRLIFAFEKTRKILKYYGQDISEKAISVCKQYANDKGLNFEGYSSDTLSNPMFLNKKFDCIVGNPPYSVKWDNNKELINDERFSSYGVLAPKSKADYAFILTMLHSLKEDGTMAVVLPHGVIFRGGTEEKIRKTLIEKNYIDAIIGLPANTFYGTTIPTLIMILKKNRENKDVLFIDASREFEKGKNKNYIREQDIAKIFDTYIERKEIEKYSHNATFEEIEKNGFNLNIPRYVDCFEEEEPVDIDVKFKNLEECLEKSKELDIKLEGYFKELGLDCKNLFKSKDGE